MPVAFVQVPDVRLVALATKYALRDEVPVAPPLASMSAQAGTVPDAAGFVAILAKLFRATNRTIRFPTLCAGNVTDDVALTVVPVILKTIKTLADWDSRDDFSFSPFRP
jgi:hypothetical protein